MLVHRETEKTGSSHTRKRRRYGRLEYAGRQMEPVTRQKPYQLEYLEKLKEKKE